MSTYTRYKNSIFSLTAKLRQLEAQPENYELLLDLQRDLVRLIRRAESRVVHLKRQRANLNSEKRKGQLPREQADVIKERIRKISAQTEVVQHMQFIWRCFGDGIAYTYINKYALKHMLYDSRDYTVKQAPGALSNKDGFKLEWKIVRSIIKRGIPIMLCDVSNILRYGDVCALIGPDPLPIEVKSSKNRNARVDRQLEGLMAVRNFLENDEARNFRGIPYVKRVEMPLSDASHAAVMCECIERSRADGFAQVSPEEGLTYACIRNPEAVSQLDALSSETIMAFVNDPKTEGNWMPYYPFTLSIRDPLALYEFISGDISLVVMVDANFLVRLFKGDNLNARFIEDRNYILHISRLNTESVRSSVSLVSRQAFGRLFYDFETLAALPRLQYAHIELLEREGAEQEAKITSGESNPEDLMVFPIPDFKSMRWPSPSDK